MQTIQRRHVSQFISQILRDLRFPVSLTRSREMVLETCSQYTLPENWRLSLLSNTIEVQALEYSYTEPFEELESCYNYPHAQEQAQSCLESLSIAWIRDLNKFSAQRTLGIALKRVSTVAPMCEPDPVHESHQARWSGNMLRSEEWAQQFRNNWMKITQYFKTFDAALHADLKQLTIGQATKGTTMNRSQLVAVSTPTFFGKRYTSPNPHRETPHAVQVSS